MMALPSLRWPNALRFSPVPLDPLETVLFYGPTPRLVRLPLSILRVQRAGTWLERPLVSVSFSSPYLCFW